MGKSGRVGLVALVRERGVVGNKREREWDRVGRAGSVEGERFTWLLHGAVLVYEVMGRRNGPLVKRPSDIFC